ncbi:MAG: carbohydrate ABC transporter permease [Pseudomonadota bacterium]|nr:carbohydrate ABC transporter permease [Pseudomonadota bacterium]MEE3101314.1 carbohydrate ABC transporter permease [Pseudomonadota bacterium]
MELSRSWRVVGHLALLICCLAVAAPVAVVLATALKSPAEVFQPSLWPSAPTFDNFATLFGKARFADYLWNSAGTTVLRVGGQLVIALLAAWAFARFAFRGRDTVFALVLGAMMIPHLLTMIPVYILMARLGWFDTWAALIVPNLAMPFAVFLLRQHMRAFPRDLLDAAEMDGAGPWRALWKVVVPNLAPALAALTIILFVECWNEYFWPLLVTESEASRTLQMGLREFLESDGYSDFGAMMAGVTLASIPAVALFLILQRRVMDTFVASGLKG